MKTRRFVLPAAAVPALAAILVAGVALAADVLPGRPGPGPDPAPAVRNPGAAVQINKEIIPLPRPDEMPAQAGAGRPAVPRPGPGPHPGPAVRNPGAAVRINKDVIPLPRPDALPAVQVPRPDALPAVQVPRPVR